MNIPAGEPLQKFQLDGLEQHLAQRYNVQKLKASDFLKKSIKSQNVSKAPRGTRDQENLAN